MKNLTLRSLLMLGFGLLLALLAVIGGLSIYSTGNLSTSIKDLAERRMPNIINYGAVETQVYTLRSLALSVLQQEKANAQSANNLSRVLETRKKTWAELDETMKKIESVPRTIPVIIELYNKLIVALDAYRTTSTLQDNHLPKMIAAASAGDSALYFALQEEYKEMLAGVATTSQALREAVSECMKKQMSQGAAEGAAAIESSSTFSMLISTLVIAGILGGILVGFMTLRAVIRQIGGEPGYIQSIMQHVSNADLSVKVDLRSDDTSSALYAISVTISRLREIVDIISRSANEIAAASEELSATSEKIASSSESQS
ncbi:MAG: methyl-accepting chemotaxis protein, partial [Betaproteobacteria bacterium]|nr:methyl-accepting chemotaxis protein [Betaproteobacteria bacterium]